MPRRGDEIVDIDLPFFHFRIGGRGWRRKAPAGENEEEVIEMERDDSDEYWAVRRRVRARLRILRHAFTFLAVNTVLFLVDLSTGGGYWVQWVALIWGVFLAWEFVSVFVAPALWGPDAEERLIQRELRRRRGS
jgi:hypothetical protein